jgi:hypothetical protein
MSVKHALIASRETVKTYIDRGDTPEWAELSAAHDMLDSELRESRFRMWLRLVKHLVGEPMLDVTAFMPADAFDTARVQEARRNAVVITDELWDEWQSAKASYNAEENAKAAAAEAARKAASESDRKRQRAKQVAAENAEAANIARLEDRVAKVQAFELPPMKPLEPIDYKKIHDLKKRPEKSKRELEHRWSEQLRAQPGDVQVAWAALHQMEIHEYDVRDVSESDDESQPPQSSVVSLIPLPPGRRRVDIYNVDDVVRGLRDTAFYDFRVFSAGVHRALGVIGHSIDDVIVPPHDPNRPLPAQDVDDIEADDDAGYVVPGLIAKDGLTVVHGDPGVCKSLWLQRLCLPVADNTGATFDGRQIEHGQVIFATLDPSAAPKAIKPGVIEIRDRLGLKGSGRMQVTGFPLILNEPASVAHWIELNKVRLPAKLIVIDSLFSAVTGSLAQDSVVQGAMDGIRALLQYADAVVIAHHDNRGGDIFGSVFLTAMMAGKIAISRPLLRNGRPGSKVTVTVERLKFADPLLEPPLTYTLDGPFLAGAGDDVAADHAAAADAAPIKRPDIQALLATDWTPLAAARRLVNHLLGDGRAAEKTWQRLRKEWADAGLIEQRDGNIRRMS